MLSSPMPVLTVLLVTPREADVRPLARAEDDCVRLRLVFVTGVCVWNGPAGAVSGSRVFD